MVAAPIRLGELAARLECTLEGDPDAWVRGVAALGDAGPEELSFVRSRRYARTARDSRAGALVAPPGLDVGGRPVLRAEHPDLVFARAVHLILPPPRPEPGVHATAVVEPEAHVDASASVGPYCVVGARSRVGPRSVLRAGVTLYEDVAVGADCTLHAGVTVREDVSIGDRVVLHPGVVIGADGFGYAHAGEGPPQKLPQVGRVVIEDDVEIGANAAVDRAALGETRVRRGAKIDDLCVVGHNCDIGEGAVLAALTGLSGSARVGRGAFLMGQTGVADHVTIGERAFLGGRAGVVRDVPARTLGFGYPLLEPRLHHRVQTLLKRLPELFRRVRALERGAPRPPAASE